MLMFGRTWKNFLPPLGHPSRGVSSSVAVAHTQRRFRRHTGLNVFPEYHIVEKVYNFG